MFALDSPGQEPDLDRERRAIDADRLRLRTQADHERLENRELLDGTRQALRGDRQTRESLRRERASEDESLRVEREASDLTRADERCSSDARAAHANQARSDSEGESRRNTDREGRRTKELRDVMALVETQIEVVTARLTALLNVVPRGTFEGELSESVATIRTATDRMRQLLEDVLDPGDTRCRDHDQGGSG